MSDHQAPMSDVWGVIAWELFFVALKRPWRRVRWHALRLAVRYSLMPSPPQTWPGDVLPMDWRSWR